MPSKTKPLNETAYGQDAATDSDSKTQNKAEVRRNQVRKAQIQHRQRKANYVRELEKDIARMREQVAAEQREVQAMLAENDAMKAQLRQRIHQTSSSPLPPLSLDEGLSLLGMVPQPPLFNEPQGPEDINFTFAFADGVMGPACYDIDGLRLPSQDQMNQPAPQHSARPLPHPSMR